MSFRVSCAGRQAAGLVLLCTATFAASAADAPQPVIQAELASESSHLGNGSANWRETSLRLTQQLSQRSVRSIAFTQTSRFGLQDQELSALLSLRLADQLTASFEGSFSPTHRVLARQSLAATLQYEFQPTWIAHVGLGTRRYDSSNVDSGLLMIEHYFSDFSASLAWKPVRASGSSASSTELRASYYYANANSIGIILSQGSEPTTLGPGNVVLTDVRAAALLGRYWLDPQWAITYALSQTRQGDFYTRRSVRLGAKHVF
jgi:YaiO family outer membrane protein